MMKEFPHLFSPIQVCGVTFKNRICMAPQKSSGPAKDGYIVERGRAYFEERARGGYGMVCIGETNVGYTPDLDTLDLEPAYRGLDLHDRTTLAHLSYSIKRHGAVACAELNHRGAFTMPIHLHQGEQPMAPSVITNDFGMTSREMTEEDMIALSEQFGDIAAYYIRCGFDMIMVHAGHSWLLGQFLSPLWNHRTDQYGGSLENRARFPLMVLENIRKKCGNVPIEVRVSGDEEMEGGIHLDETVEFCRMIQHVANIIHVSVGCSQDHNGRMFSSYYEPNGLNVKYAAAIKQAVDIPVSVVGGINDPWLAEEIIASGKADFVALGRQALADPEFARKAQEGRPMEISPCVRCMSCHSAPPPPAFAHCTVNPAATFESDPYAKVTPTDRPKRVFVAGGGPAGMKAAVTAAQCGHRVTLFEEKEFLGGTLEFTDYDAFKHDLNKFKRHLVYMTEHSGVEIRLGTALTPEIIEAEQPDAVVAAVGASPIIPPIPGIQDHGVMTAVEAFRRQDRIQGSIAIIGGGLVGLETGIHFASRGCQVTVVEAASDTMRDAFIPTKGWVRQKLEEYKARITVLTDTPCRAVSDGGIVVLRDGAEALLAADHVICAVGMRSNSSSDLREAAPYRFDVIGDAKRPGKVTEAVHEGYFTALDI